MMMGSKHGRRCAAAMGCLVLAGCLGPPNGMNSTRQNARAVADEPVNDLRIADSAVAQGPDIPLVPVPSPPVGRPAQQPPPPRKDASQNLGAATPPRSPDLGAPGQPSSPAPPHTARQLLQQATARCGQLDAYIVRLTRREHLKDKMQPEEILMFKFRKQPFSVHFKWLGDAARGREVVYVKGKYENKIHTKLAAGDAPLMAAGSRLSVAPDSMLARAASRHPITDAGLCHCVEKLTAVLNAQERGDKRQGTLSAIAPQVRPEYPRPVETLEQILPPGAEPQLPRGGRRLLCFDPDWQLPMLVATYDDKGREVEYYRYDRMQAPVNLDDDDFNPDKLWPAPNRDRNNKAK